MNPSLEDSIHNLSITLLLKNSPSDCFLIKCHSPDSLAFQYLSIACYWSFLPVAKALLQELFIFLLQEFFSYDSNFVLVTGIIPISKPFIWCTKCLPLKGNYSCDMNFIPSKIRQSACFSTEISCEISLFPGKILPVFPGNIPPCCWAACNRERRQPKWSCKGKRNYPCCKEN